LITPNIDLNKFMPYVIVDCGPSVKTLNKEINCDMDVIKILYERRKHPPLPCMKLTIVAIQQCNTWEYEHQ